MNAAALPATRARSTTARPASGQRVTAATSVALRHHGFPLKTSLRRLLREPYYFLRQNILPWVLPSVEPRPAPADHAICVAGVVASSSGLGKSARLCIEELNRLGRSVHMHDVAGDFGLDDGMATTCGHPAPARFRGIKIWHLNPPMLLPTILRHTPFRFFDTFNIGYWAWELDVMPREWLAMAQMMDAVMVTSTFVAKSLTGAAPGKVHVVHHPVALPNRLKPLRQSLGISQDTFVVSLIFNYGSAFERKNPVAGIRAFLKAFDGIQDVRLIIKTTSGDAHRAEREQVASAAGSDSRILVIDELWSDLEVLSLIAASDTLISLHRSEGFGLNIAEAMHLGVPVVASNWSGNTDFCLPDNSMLVDARLIEVIDRHPHLRGAKGARWADPDILQAAEHLRRLYRDPAFRRHLAAKAQADIRHLRSAFSYEKALAEIQRSGRASGDAAAWPGDDLDAGPASESRLRQDSHSLRWTMRDRERGERQATVGFLGDCGVPCRLP